ncbi:ferrochelatase [Cryptobacterium curtum]|uniref:ferrochelatase n=1 Tax=Cryptobacterium curtum TaxID=84163 RepID=UPI00248EC6F8|nr:ferrochelatase [Cryptobacterium curtum]
MKTGIIIGNAGSPSAPTAEAVRDYLASFLVDRRIRPLPQPIWHLLLHGIILPRRPVKSALRYKRIWQPAGSPLVIAQDRLASLLQESFARSEDDVDAANDTDTEVIVHSAMCYGAPSMTDALRALKDKGCKRIILLPLYPQSAYSSTYSVIDAFEQAIDALHWPDAADIQVVKRYADRPRYLDAIAGSIQKAGFGDRSDDKLLISLHAIPLKDERNGDSYRAQIHQMVEHIAERLEIDVDDITLGFQSVFGPHKASWTTPLSTDILKKWHDEGLTSRVFFICPGFALDCLETLHDIPREMMALLEFGATADDLEVPAAAGDTAAAAALAAIDEAQRRMVETTETLSLAGDEARFKGVRCLGSSPEEVALLHEVALDALNLFKRVGKEGSDVN